MRTDTTTTFAVSEVQRAAKLLPEVLYKQSVEALLTTAVPEHDRRRVENRLAKGLSSERPDAAVARPVEACARYHGRLLAGVTFHPVVAAVHRAFMDHRPLRLSPDAIWLMICQAVANHVNAHADELRPRLVQHQGRMTIDVRRDDFVKGSPEKPWPEVFAEFSAKVRDHVGPTLDLFLPAFSTTGAVERAAAEVVLLDAVQSYFDYTVYSLCGIPAIALEGTTEDWEALAGRAEAFAHFGLEQWVETLRPILRQFVRATQGIIEKPFWNSIYKFSSRSGGSVVTGWITAFFPYLRDHGTGRANVPVEGFFESGGSPIDKVLYPGEEEPEWFVMCPSIKSFPGGLSKAPFRWQYLDRPFAMEFLGGFVGVAQDDETFDLRPEIGWAVREAPIED
jgi:Domain of unknown function (DUF4419)